MQDGMFREVRYIKGSKTTSIPKRVISLSCNYRLVDGSSCGQYGRMEFAGGCVSIYDPGYRDDAISVVTDIRRPADMLELIESLVEKRSLPWLVSQNLGRDLTLIGFWDLITNGSFKWTKRSAESPDGTADGCDGDRSRRGVLVTNDPPVIIVGWWSGHKVVMVDTRNFSYEQLPDSYHCVDRAKGALEYILGLCDWVQKNDLGKLRYTTSGIAYEAFKHRFMTHKICPHGNSEAVKLERKAYFGGRSSLFRYGEVKGEVYKLDVQGLFPSVMRDNLFPIHLDSISLMNGKRYDGEEISSRIARVQIESPACEYPVRDIETGKVHYAFGRYSSYLCGQELLQAEAYRHVKYSGMVCRYKMAPIFTSYVDFFWRMRILSREAGELESERIAKAMLVGLYGKFGQKSLRWRDRPNEWSPMEWGHWWKCVPGERQPELFRSVGYNTQQIEEGGETAESFPAIAAFVTSYARQRMDKLRSIAGEKHVYCQVIDCLFVDYAGYCNLCSAGEVIDNQIGKLSERGVSDGATFYSPGDYCFAGDYKVAGVSLAAKGGENNAYRAREETRLNGILSGYPGRGISVREVLKHMRREPPPQGLDDDGWVKPTIWEE